MISDLNAPPRVGRSPREPARRPPADPGRRCSLLLDDREHVAGGKHKVLIACVLHFGAAVLAVQHDIANLDVHRNALGASVVEPAWSNGDDLALLWLLLGGVWDHEPGRGGL